MLFQANASGTFQEDHLHIRHIYLITASVAAFSKFLEGHKNHDLTETRQ
jgi:hypothetical protein